MKKVFIISLLFCALIFKSQTILPIPTVIQEQNEWCWAGCTKSILDYYGFPNTQCQIADYTRTVATWHNYGTVNCCVTGSLSCNYWNYNWGWAGSMQDILTNFGSISNVGVSSTLSIATITTEISAGRPFIIRWGWTSGGGHFIVGKGFDVSNNIYYMNPWPGEGSKMSTYTWLVNDGVHSWTHTNRLTTSPISTSINEAKNTESDLLIYPNPVSHKLTINTNSEKNEVELFDVSGKKVFDGINVNSIDVEEQHLSKGLYFIKITCENKSVTQKVIVE